MARVWDDDIQVGDLMSGVINSGTHLIGQHRKLIDNLTLDISFLTYAKEKAKKDGDVDYSDYLDILIDYDEKLRVLEHSVIDSLNKFFEREEKDNGTCNNSAGYDA